MLAAATGEVPAALATESAARPLVASGKLRVLATTGNERSPFFPGAPTLRESGWPALVIQEWFGAFMPPRTAPQTVNAMAGLLHASLADSDIKSTWETLGLIPETSTPAQLRDDIRDEHKYWGNVVKALGFTPES
jgi:tripartite-type tricarboxylate transporter receptor subunit TctC